MQAVRIETKKRVVREEQRSSRSYSNMKLDPVVGVTVAVMIAVRTARPAGSVLKRSLSLPCPSGVVHLYRHTVRWRCHRQQVRDHHFVESNQRMMNLPRPLL